MAGEFPLNITQLSPCADTRASFSWAVVGPKILGVADEAEPVSVPSEQSSLTYTTSVANDDDHYQEERHGDDNENGIPLRLALA
ncbi:hypothetical protein N7508_004317 [Penicillium antarcticum]|uniref:uncharacterized protein n=1 Tax=Penicillium antarcticum TaxID=416450 RepID=UPI0023A78DB3|nr:uncharacterized protein N7508_004317 [Penicillium antarcticum]KAJ5308938.1 hypothetical protein N7508_004317 [Penicillium antarcticum]